MKPSDLDTSGFVVGRAQENDFFADLRTPGVFEVADPLRDLACDTLRQAQDLRARLDDIIAQFETLLQHQPESRVEPWRGDADQTYEDFVRESFSEEQLLLPIRAYLRLLSPEPTRTITEERLLGLLAPIAWRRSVRRAASQRALARLGRPHRAVPEELRVEADAELERALVHGHPLDAIAAAPDEPIRYSLGSAIDAFCAAAPQVIGRIEISDLSSAIAALETPPGRWQRGPLFDRWKKSRTSPSRWTFVRIFLASLLGDVSDKAVNSFERNEEGWSKRTALPVLREARRR